jgi:hypothetical protein
MKPKYNFCKCNLLITAKFFFISVLIICSAACSKEPLYKEYLIKVDSITVELPQRIETSGIFSIHLYGTISGDGCSSFSHTKTYLQNQDLIIEAWKNVKVHALACPTVMVYLDQSITLNRNSLPENFIIKVKQPDGSYLEKLIK